MDFGSKFLIDVVFPDPDSPAMQITLLINSFPLCHSWKGWRKQYNKENKNYFACDDASVVRQYIKRIAEACPGVKVIVVDTINGLMVADEMRRSKEKGYDKWVDLAACVWDLVCECYTYREDLTIVFTAHTQTDHDENGYMFTRIKTSGAQREKVRLLQYGGADQDEIILHKAKYQGQLNEYSRFCRKMSLTEERERIYLDMRGKVATNNKSQNSMFHPEMVKNASKDVAQYKRYKEVLGDSVGSLAKFGQVKYNDSEQWEKLQNRFSTHLEINKKDWSEEFKNTSKQAYDRFREQGEELSVHALSRLPRLNKPGYEVIHEEDVLDLIKTMPNYSEGEEKMIWFSPSKQLVVIKNKNSGDIVSIVRRKNKKEEWTDAGL